MSRLAVAHLTWKRYLERGLLPLGVNLKQTFVLGQLSRREYLNPSEIAEMLFCDRPTATVVVANMQRRGWVTRTRNPADAKRVMVAITDEGRSVLAAAGDLTRPAFEPLGCFSEGEKLELDALLARLCKHLSTLPTAPKPEEVR